MLEDYRKYLFGIRNNLIQCGVEFPISSCGDYRDLYELGCNMDSLLWYYSVLEISGSEDRLKGFFLPLGNHFKDRMKKVFYEEFQIFLKEYNKLSVRSYINNPKYKHTTNLLDIYSNADENLVKLTDIGVEGSASTKTPNNTKDTKDCAYEEVEHGKFLEDYEEVVEEEVEEDSKFEEHGRYLEDYSSEEAVEGQEEDWEEDWEEIEELEESESILEDDNLDSDWVEESDWSEETVEGTESDWIEDSDWVDEEDESDWIEEAGSDWVESDEFEGGDSGDDWIEETSESDWVEEEEVEEEEIEELGSDWVEASDDWVEEEEVEETSESDWVEEDESDWVEEEESSDWVEESESGDDWIEEDDSGDDWIEEDDSDWIEEPEDNIKSTPNTTVRDRQPVKSAPSKPKVPEKDISDYIQDLTNGFLTSSKRAIIKGLRKLDK